MYAYFRYNKVSANPLSYKTNLKPVAFILLFLIHFPLYAQEPDRPVYRQDHSTRAVPPFLSSLYKKSDEIVSFRVKFADSDERSDYFILTKKGNSLLAYNYFNKEQELTPANLSKERLRLVWNTFLQNELFSVQDEKDIPNFCPAKYQIYNSHTYEFVLLTKGTMKRLSYYDPEYYDNACYGMPERRKIINSASVINYVLGP
ncbi:hypothetical protein [Daejeonella sp.]|uniref:hypothetical protein n=1 Tax=Daejeonella sp. TaxID=2805397 RepID=UPI0030C4F8A7